MLLSSISQASLTELILVVVSVDKVTATDIVHAHYTPLGLVEDVSALDAKGTNVPIPLVPVLSV